MNGLVQEVSERVDIDYSKNFVETYSEWTRRIILKSRKLEIIITNAEIEDTKPSGGLPLWTPRWVPDNVPIECGSYRACGETDVRVREEGDLNTLVIEDLAVAKAKNRSDFLAEYEVLHVLHVDVMSKAWVETCRMREEMSANDRAKNRSYLLNHFS